jgi:hypothetical protein
MEFRLIAVCAVMVLTGCASVPRQPFNKEANPHVRKIALVSISSPEEYSVSIVNHPGASFGLIGGIAAAADISSKSTEFTKLQGDKRKQIGPELANAITQALTQNGTFEIVQVDSGSKGQPRIAYLKDYPQAECDAYLDVVIQQAGYIAQYATTPYVPTLSVPVRLVDAKSKTVLYTTTFFMTDGNIPDGGKQLPPDPSYGFKDFDELKAAAGRSGDGLRNGVNTVAKQIAADLR